MENKLIGNIFLTSDWHLGHANIAGPWTTSWERGHRDFKSVEEMDHTIIDNINKIVGPQDIIMFLGDFSFGGHTKIPDYRRRIMCENIHFIRGNHDQHIMKYKDFFTSIHDKWEGSLNSIPFVLCHYSMRIWIGSHKGFLHAYGHSHSSLEKFPHGKSMDVGIDNAYKVLGEYRPFTLKEVVDILNKRPIAFVDSHGANTNA